MREMIKTKEIVKKYYDDIPDLIEEMHRNSAALGLEGVQRLEVETETKEVSIGHFMGGQEWNQGCETLFILREFDWLFEIDAQIMDDPNWIIADVSEAAVWYGEGRPATEKEKERFGYEIENTDVRVIDREEAYDCMSWEWMNECIEEAQTAYDEIFEQQEEDDEE